MERVKANLWKGKFRLLCTFYPLLVLVLLTKPLNAQPRLVDLTHPFDETTIYWPTNKTFHLDSVFHGRTDKGYWYESNDITASEHGGTHLDAPAHFAKGGWHIEDIPLESLIAPGVVIDIRNRVKNKPDTRILPEDILNWEKNHGRIAQGSIILILTGWEAFWPNKKLYLGTDKPGDVANLHFPGFSKEAAELLAHDRKVAAVGLDTPSLDYGQSKNFPAHQVFGAANIPGFENVCQLAKLPSKGFRVIALPMLIGKGSGAPLRIIAEIGP